MRTLLLVLLLLAAVMAQSTENAGYASVRLQISGYSPQPQTLYVPQDNTRQTVDYGKLPIQYDEYGNGILVIEGNYSFIFDVEIDASKPVILADQKFPVGANGLQEYLEETPYCEVNDPVVKQRGLDVTRNSRTVLEAIRDLALWTNAYLEYDTTYWGDILTATEALALRKGVCDEFTNVYTAMARSLGIPTRIVTGVVYTGSQWQRHAWAESRVGDEWVPVDATFSEVGLVNALHIKLYSAPSYLFYQFPQSLEDVRVLDFTVEEYDVPITVRARLSETRIAPKGTFYLTANISNNGGAVLIPTYAAQKTVGVDLLSDFRQGAIVAPGETKTLEWKFAAPFGERDTYYVFLVGPAVDEKYPIIVDPMMAAEGYGDFEIKNVYATIQGEEIRIEVEAKNRGNYNFAGVSVTVITDLGTQRQSFALASGDSETVDFYFPAEEGTHSYEIRVEAGNSTTNAFGSLAVPRSGKSQSVFGVVNEFLAENATWLYIAIAILIVGALMLVLLVPLQEERKIPFEERAEWSKLMKLRKG